MSTIWEMAQAIREQEAAIHASDALPRSASRKIERSARWQAFAPRHPRCA